MATLNEIVFDIIQTVRPLISDDEVLTGKYIEHQVGVQRALWLRNELNRNRTIDPGIVQSLGCVELTTVDESECCDFPVGCSIVRSKEKIPETIELHNSTGFTYVGPVSKTAIGFSLKPLSHIKFSGNGRFNKRIVFATYHNGYIYLVSNDKYYLMMENINVQGVFEDPLEAIKFSHCDGKPCYDKMVDDYPLKDWMIPMIKEQIINQLVASKQQPIDTTNDSNTETDTVNG